MNLENIKLVIFDWAGTTVDYGSFAPVHAFDRAFRAFGVEPTVDEIRKPMGLLKRDHIRTMLQMTRLEKQWELAHHGKPTDEDVEKIYHSFEESLLESLERFAYPKPGVLEVVKGLRDRGIAIGSTTGYTDKMMNIVAPNAAKAGYEPDMWISPDAVYGMGRPYPYMIFENMKHFHIKSVDQVLKIGDTVADIQEGKNAGVRSIGVIEGSSIMGFTEDEYESLPESEREMQRLRCEKVFLNAGADGVIRTIAELL